MSLNQNNLGVPDIYSQTMQDMVRACLSEAGKHRQQPVMFLGAPGVGKSSIIALEAAKTFSLLIDFRLSSCDPTDIGGTPVVVVNDMGRQVIENVQRGNLPFEGIFYLGAYNKVVLLLDEANLASQDVMKTLYSILQERRVNGYKLIDECVILLAGNRAQDGVQVEDMGTALNNRIQVLNVVTTAKDWRESLRKYSAEYRTGNIRFQLMSLLANDEAPYTSLFEPENIKRWEYEWERYVSDKTTAAVDALRQSKNLEALKAFGDKEIQEIRKQALELKVEKPQNAVDFYTPFMLRRLNITFGEPTDAGDLQKAYEEWLMMAAVDKDGKPLGDGTLPPAKQFAVMTAEEKKKWQQMLVEINMLGQSAHAITSTDEYALLRHKNSVVEMFAHFLKMFREHANMYNYSSLIRAFIMNMTDEDLCSLGTSLHEQGHIPYASPRSWSNFFAQLNTEENQRCLNAVFFDHDKSNSNSQDELEKIRNLAHSIVGVAGRNKFMKHLTLFKDFPTLQEIMAKPDANLLTPEQRKNKESMSHYAHYLHSLLSMLKPNQKQEAKALMSQALLKEYGDRFINSDLNMYFQAVLQQKFPAMMLEKVGSSGKNIQQQLKAVFGGSLL